MLRNSPAPWPNPEPDRRLALQHQLLPFIEQDSLRRRWNESDPQFNLNQRDENGVLWGPGFVFMRQVVKTFQCPSNPIPSPLNVAADPASSGRYFINHYFGNAGNRSHPRGPTVGRPNLYDFQDGMFTQNSRFKFSDVTDGTSNTLLYGERHYFDPVFDTQTGDRIYTWGWCWFGATGDAMLGSGVPINYKLPLNFSTLSGGTQQLLYEDRLNAFGSAHTGGANFAMTDGSVRFIRDSITPLTFRAVGTRASGEVFTSDF